jgi:lipopolysaccharide export system permease protein
MGRIVMNIFFRYLFVRLFIPFAVCLCACTLIWIMADLYGNIDDFLEHKVNVLVILRFYLLQIPSMLVQVLPATLLISTLWTLISLNRRSELVAFQSGGMAPLWLFSPFFVFGLIWVAILAFDLNWPAAKAEVTRDRLLQQVKGEHAKSNVFDNLPYVDSTNNRIWFFQSLDANQGTAKGVEILQRDADGHDMVKYFAQRAEYNDANGFWRLFGVLKIDFGVSETVRQQQTFAELDLTEINTPPKQLSLIVSQPAQLTLSQLSQYIDTSTTTEDNIAKYRTEWWYRILYPFSLIVLMLFALQQGAHTDRRNTLGGVTMVIVVLLAFIALTQLFMAFGSHNRLPPFIAAIATEVIFGAVGLYLLGVTNGWWWQLVDTGKRLKAKWDEEHKDEE